MKSALLILCLSFIEVIVSDEVLKCCSEDEVLNKDEEVFKCIPDTTKRLQINTNITNVLTNSTVEECYDVLNNNFIRLDVNKKQVFRPKGTLFPKCCPLNYFYNSKLHSCIPSRDLFTNNFIKESFITVGLTNCKTVVDFRYEQTKYFKFGLIDSGNNVSRNSLDNFGSFCIDRNEIGDFVLRECQTSIGICDSLKCIKKCCPDGQSYLNGSKCRDSYEHGMNLSTFGSIVENYEENFAIIHNRTCPKIYIVNALTNITIHKNGSYTEWLPNRFITEHVGNMNSYCMEHYQKGPINDYFIFHCFPEQSTALTKFDLRLWPFVTSCVFLILTIVVYIIIKEWKKMFGKILINYCIASLFVFGILTLGESKEQPSVAECQIRAFLLIFSAIAQFSWANVMSFEIWFTFGTTRIYLGADQRDMELKKFMLYSLYGWGGPTLLTLVTLLFFQWKVLPYEIQPFIGEIKCFYDYKTGNYAKLVFLNIPLLIVQIINMVLFVKTVIYCVQVRNEINKRNNNTMTNSAKKFNHDRERLYLILKLSIVMGISLIFEVVTAFFNMSDLGVVAKYIEIIFDLFNALQGVFIFIIFICKKKVLQAVAKKFTIFGISYTPSTSSIRTHSSMTLNGVGSTTNGNHSCQKVV